MFGFIITFVILIFVLVFYLKYRNKKKKETMDHLYQNEPTRTNSEDRKKQVEPENIEKKGHR